VIRPFRRDAGGAARPASPARTPCRTATVKAWTAWTFRTSTSELAGISQPGMPQAGLRALPAWSFSAAA
jgi:uncharacterized protein GlcG (DUF336 family)